MKVLFGICQWRRRRTGTADYSRRRRGAIHSSYSSYSLISLSLSYYMFLHGNTFPQAIAGVAVMAYQTVQSLSIRLRD